MISVKCELISLSLKDDTEEVTKSLISANFKGINLSIVQNVIDKNV